MKQCRYLYHYCLLEVKESILSLNLHRIKQAKKLYYDLYETKGEREISLYLQHNEDEVTNNLNR